MVATDHDYPFSVLFGVSRENADIASIAVNAVRAGYAVLPVHPNSKRPMCTLPPTKRAQEDKRIRAEAEAKGQRGWQSLRHSNSGDCGLKHAITCEKEARRVFGRLIKDLPDLNIALEVGRSRMICVDADNTRDVETFAKFWADMSGVPELEYVMPTVTSPGVVRADADGQDQWIHKGGGHYWFKLPEGVSFDDSLTATGLTIPHPDGTPGPVVYFRDRVLLVPPSVREEGPYVLNSEVGTAPEWLTGLVRMHVDGYKERRQMQRSKLIDGEDPIDVWSAQTTWSELLEPDGWTDSAKFDNCQCSIWTRPGDWSSPKSATAHEPGCTSWEGAFLHVWTDNPAVAHVEAYIAATGSKTMSKLQYVAWRDFGGDYAAAMTDLGVGALRDDPLDLLPPEDREALMAEFNAKMEQAKVVAEAVADLQSAEPITAPAEVDKELADLIASLVPRPKLAELPPAQWLIDNWLTRDSLTRLSGRSGSFKSFVAVDMACSVAAGTDFHGSRVRAPGRVLYIAAEGIRGMHKRVRAWEKEHGVDVVEQITFIPRAVYAKRPEKWRALCQLNAMMKYDLIIVDTQARTTAGMNENDNTEMGDFVALCEQLQQAGKSCVMIVHHTGHDQNRGRGASSMLGAMDIELLLIREEDRSAMRTTLSVEKSKDHDETTPITFNAVVSDTGLVDEEGQPLPSLVLLPSVPDILPEKEADPRAVPEFRTHEEKIMWWVAELDAAELKNSTGRPTAAKAIKAMGYAVPMTKDLEEVIKIRKAR